MKHLVLIFASIYLSNYCYSQYNYPPTKTVDSADIYFGVTYSDSYRWLEYINDAEVDAWFKNQADFADSILNKLTGRDELIAEWEKLDKLQPPAFQGRNYFGGRYFYKKTLPGEFVGKVYYREGINGTEHLLFDPSNFIEDKTLSVTSTLPSYDGKKLIIAYSEVGAEISTIRIMDVDSKTFLPESIYPSWFGPISWSFDNKSFTYFSQKTADNTSLEFELNTKTKLHILGDDVKNDKDFFSNESYPNLEIQANDLPFAGFNKDSKNYLFADLFNVRNEFFTYYAPVSQFGQQIEWKILSKPEDAIVRGREIIGDEVFAITYKNAKNFKLIHTNLLNPDWENAETIIDEKSNLTLEAITHCKDYLIATYSDGINNQVFKYNFNTKEISEIKMPFNGTAAVFCLDNETNICYFIISSWNRPKTEYKVNIDDNLFTESEFNKAPNYPDEYLELVAEEVEVKAHDGAMIPLTIIYKKGLKLDGTNSCLMQAYGAYGISYTPWFDNRISVLALKNVVIAIAHVRGGSEKGQEWYKAGFKTTKPNTWKDFNSCAEYLINKGFTSAKKLAGEGTSAGGILISRAITERPDLYAAAICNVGLANAMRFEFTPNGPANIPEFGTVKDSIECKALYEMDGLLHIVKGTEYPAVIGIAGWNDPRVIAWQPGKFVAAVQNASSSDKPAILKINYDNGHFTEDKRVTYANFAAQFAFAMWQCGHSDFQLKE